VVGEDAAEGKRLIRRGLLRAGSLGEGNLGQGARLGVGWTAIRNTTPPASWRHGLSGASGRLERCRQIGSHPVTQVTASDRCRGHIALMSNIVTHSELLEIVSDLRAMAAAEQTAMVRAALNRLVDRYTAMSSEDRSATPRMRPAN
jgi:hypothetical protein